MDEVCRWGVLGTATIARKFWQAARNAGNARIVAIASRDAARASGFVAECQGRFPVHQPVEGIGSYGALLSREDVDAVYVPLPTGVRREWVEAAAAQGKHVLCEKPCAVSTDELRRMIDACRQSGVQFMDNVMFPHSQRLAAVLNRLRDAEWFGALRQISTQFSFPAPPDFFRDNIRSRGALEPWGCLGDLGWYCIRIALMAGPSKWPLRVRGEQGHGGLGWDTARQLPTVEFRGEIRMADDVACSLYCSFVTVNQQWVYFSGTRASLQMPDFVLPWYGSRSSWTENAPEFNRTGWDFNYESRESVQFLPEYSNGHPSAQEAALVRTFSGLVLSGQIDESWSTVALRTQAVMDGLMQSAQAGGSVVEVADPLASGPC